MLDELGMELHTLKMSQIVTTTVKEEAKCILIGAEAPDEQISVQKEGFERVGRLREGFNGNVVSKEIRVVELGEEEEGEMGTEECRGGFEKVICCKDGADES